MSPILLAVSEIETATVRLRNARANLAQAIRDAKHTVTPVKINPDDFIKVSNAVAQCDEALSTVRDLHRSYLSGKSAIPYPS